MKKFISLVLALVMALSLTTAAWGANDAGVTVDGTLYETANSLLTALTNNSAENKTFLLNAGEHAACVVSNTYVLDGTVIDGGDAATTKIAGLKIASSEGIDNLTIQNVTFTGDLHISGGATTNITIKDCVFADGTQLYIGAQGFSYNHANVKVIDCDFLGSAASGTSRLTIQCPASATVTGNTFESSGYHAVQLGGTCSGTITVTDNTITGAVKDGFRFADFASGAVLELQNNIIADTATIGRGAINADDALPATVKAWNNDWNGAALLVEDVASAALADIGSGVTTDANGLITGGTFTSAPANVADGYEALLTPDGTYVVVEEAANTGSASGLYAKATSKGAVKQENITLNFFKAVDNKVDKKTGEYVADGNVAYYMIDGVLTKYAEVYTLADADMVIYTDEACKNVYAYLDVVNPFYVGDGVVTKNFGTACGQYSNDEDDGFDDEATYYVVFDQLCVGVEAGQPYDAQILVNGKLVAVNASDIPMNLHKAIYTRNDKGVITSIKCSVCGVAAVKAANYAVLPEKVVMVDENVAPLWYWASAAAVTPSTDKVQSAETFDAGIAMYVGMSIMAATGAVVLKKKD